MKIHKKIGNFLESLNENVSSELDSETILHILNLKIDEKIDEIEDENSRTMGIGIGESKISILNWVKGVISDFEKTNESNDKGMEQKENVNESNEPDYRDYFMGKLEEFEADSPADLTKDQWEEINRGWTSEDEGNYHTFFRNKMEEFGADSPADMTKEV